MLNITLGEDAVLVCLKSVSQRRFILRSPHDLNTGYANQGVRNGMREMILKHAFFFSRTWFFTTLTALRDKRWFGNDSAEKKKNQHGNLQQAIHVHEKEIDMRVLVGRN
jgi:hypothetical protein